MYSITSVEDLQELNPYIIIGCGGGGEKFSNLEGIETVGFLDDNPAKQGKPFCGLEVASNLSDLFESTEANTVAIMLPIGAEGTALKYAVQALANGKNAVVSFRSLSLDENELTKSGTLTPVVDFKHLSDVLVILQLKESYKGE